MPTATAAAAAIANPVRPCHVVAVPYPGRGHVNPMMNLCKLLVALKPDLLVTFVVTEEWLGFIGSEEKPPNISFATIPNVLPSELNRAADMPSFVGATQTKMAEPFDLLLDRLDAVHFIIADTFLMWAVDIGIKRSIPVASLWPMPASVFSVFYHFDLLAANGHYPFEVSERGEERVDYIPGIDSIRLADTPSIAHMKDSRLLRLALQIFPKVRKAQYLLISSILELEHQVIDALTNEFSFPIYTFGPAIPYSDLENSTTFSTNQTDSIPYYFEWLNSQPPSSVLYVSLGSFLSVSVAQMDEIADGLRKSGIRFLWVARGEAERLQERCGTGGMVVRWCEQLKVLCHPSVGGFWTHCGWNSATEAIFGGVPMICFPILMDQTTIRKYVVEDWMIGWDGKKGLGEGNLLRSGDIEKLVKKFMDLETEERKEMTSRAKELQKAVRGAILDGGSSKRNLDTFLQDITSFI